MFCWTIYQMLVILSHEGLFSILELVIMKIISIVSISPKWFDVGFGEDLKRISYNALALNKIYWREDKIDALLRFTYDKGAESWAYR